MVRGLTYSLILHSVLLLLIGIGLPALFEREREIQPVAISVEIVPIKEISNLPESRKPVKKENAQPKPAPKPKQKPKPVMREEAAAPEPEPVAPPKPKPEAEKDKPKPEPKPKPKPKPKEDQKRKPKQQDDAFEQLLKDLTEQAEEDTAKEKPKKPAQAATQSRSDRYDPGKPLSLSERDAIRGQFARHWRLPAGVANDYTLAVEIRILLNPDGSIRQAGVVSYQRGRYASDPAFRAAADSALRAVQLASPLQNLPADKYNTWKDIIINFDPKDMLY